MENIINDIQRILKAFTHVNLELDSRKSVVEIDFIELNIWFYNELQQIEQHLQSIYFHGNDLMLDRINDELLKIEDILKRQFEFGIRVSFENEEFIFEIQSEILNKEKDIKLIYVRQLIIFINKLRTKHVKSKTEQIVENQNDFTRSSIDDWIFEFKEKMSDEDYNILVSALIQYFEKGFFPELSKPIKINGRVNKKLFGWALNRVFEFQGKGVELSLLKFARNNISLYLNDEFEDGSYLKSNLYKYFTTQIK